MNWFTDKNDKPVDESGDQTYTDEKLIDIIDQSLAIMDKDNDGCVSFPEFIQTQEDMKRASNA